MPALKTISVVAINELQTVVREKTFMLLLVIFFLMAFFSVYIGWSTKTTSTGIYRESVQVLQQSGAKVIPPNPFLNIPGLAVFENMIVYIFLIGSLLSITVGHRAFIRERKSGIIPLIFSRPLDKIEFIGGKLVGIAAILLAIALCTFVTSLCSALLIPGLGISASEIAGLVAFYAASFLYMLIFSMFGLLFAIFTASESLALLIPVMIWIGAVFILPELTTGQNPVALLNPINISQAAPSGGAFFVLARGILSPFSISQHFTTISLHFLKLSNSGQQSIALPLAALTLYAILLVTAAVLAINAYSVTKDKLR